MSGAKKESASFGPPESDGESPLMYTLYHARASSEIASPTARQSERLKDAARSCACGKEVGQSGDVRPLTSPTQS